LDDSGRAELADEFIDVRWNPLVVQESVRVLVELNHHVHAAELAVPVAKFVRTARRRRRTGVAGVVGAWTEACDLLRAHGTDVTPGMTARDLANVTTGSIVDSLHRLAVLLDTALWSGHGAGGGTVAAAWSAVRDIRAELTGRPLRTRLKAVFTPR
jgi:hypothetical protein